MNNRQISTPHTVGRARTAKRCRLMSTQELADIFGVTTDAIRKKIYRGRLQAVKDGQRWRVDESVLTKFYQ